MNKKKKVVRYDVQDEIMGIQAVSLVDEPAIMVDFVYLSSNKPIKLAEVNKERRMVYGPILIPDMHILRIDQQTGEEYYITFTKECVMQAAHSILKKNLHHNHTIQHSFAVAGLSIVELWVKEGDSDKSVHLGFDLPIGTAMAGVYIENDDVLEEVKAGNVKGFSIEGMFKETQEQLSLSITEDQLLKELELILSEG
jgi:hypothetical protein